MRKWITLWVVLVGCEAGAPAPIAGPAERGPAARVARGRVGDALTGEPLAGARVTVVGTLRATRTGDDGGFAITRPAGFRWLRATAPGHMPVEVPAREGGALALWPRDPDDALVAARLAARPPHDHDDPDDPDLTPAARAWLLGEPPPPDLHVPPSGGRGTLRQRQVAPPETVRVYRRGPENNSCQGRVDVLPLEEYVRGVLPHEWIPSWHMESLKAGAVAARNYAWNWVLRGGKYDCADVDDTTRSQVYSDERHPRADEAVAATRGQGVIRDGRIISSEYSAENGDPTEFGVREPLCTGRARRGHGRGMCQWGTQRWATERGQNYVWMVEHYYPGATVSRPEPPRPRVELAQGLSRPSPQPCADPEGTYDCADFVPDGRSRGLFDLYVGRRVDWSLRVKNAGDGATADGPSAVVLAVELPEGLLAAERVRIETDAPAHDGETWVEHPAQGDDRNPPADAPGGPSLRFHLHGLAPGETRRVTLRLRGTGYSVPTGGPARLRAWVASIADRYEKPAWDAAPVHNDGQTFNGGDLRLLAEIDVYRPDAWTFEGGDPGLVEGWRPRGGAGALTVDPEAGALHVPIEGDDPGIVGPFTRVDAGRLGQLRVATDRPVEGQVFWRGPGQSFAEERSITATFGAEPVVLAGAPFWAGDIEQLRVDVDDGAGPVEIDEIVLEPVEPPTPDAGPADARPPDGPAPDGALPDPADGAADPPDGPDSDPPGVRPRRVVAVSHQGGCTAAPDALPTALPVLLALQTLATLRRRRAPRH